MATNKKRWRCGLCGGIFEHGVLTAKGNVCDRCVQVTKAPGGEIDIVLHTSRDKRKDAFGFHRWVVDYPGSMQVRP